MKLNKISVLDKGFVSLMSTSNDEKMLKSIQEEYYNSATYKQLSDIATATFIVKCPIFVQLFLASRPEFSFTILSTPSSELEAYVPDESEIGAKPGESLAIRKNMQATTAALLINPKAFQHDGCDRFISQVLTPISVYSELIVHGNLSNWVKFLSKTSLPKSIEPYRAAIETFLRSMWTNLDDYMVK